MTRYFFFLASREFPSHDFSHQRVDLAEDGLEGTGVSIRQTLRDMKLEYCVMGKKEVCRQ